MVAAFLLFDLDDKFSSVSASQYVVHSVYTEAPNQTIPDPAIEKSIPQKPLLKPDLKKPTPKLISLHKEPKSRLAELEARQFSLDLSGTARLEMSGMTKSANLILKMSPVKGSGLQIFDITESRLIIDGTGASVYGLDATLDDTILTVDFFTDDAGAFSIDVMLDQNILDDTNDGQNVYLEGQKFYLTENKPYRLDLSGMMRY